MNERNSAQLARVDDVLAELIVLPTPLLHPGLNDSPAFFDRPHHLSAFVDRVHDGLLAVDVLAGADRVHQHGLVPVVGRADDDRVHVLQVQGLTIIEAGLGVRPRDPERLVPMRLVDVADADDFGRRDALEQGHEVLRALARPQHADPDAVIRAQHARWRKSARKRQPGAGRRRVLQEFASGKILLIFH